MNSIELKQTPLGKIHRQSGARMVDFAGWEMPVQYAGPIQEHMAVRTRAGIFDVSHMGEVEVAGPHALETVQRVTCNDASRLSVGQCHYSGLTTASGAFVDDGLVYLPTGLCSPGTEFNVIIRGKPARARVVPTPFYRRTRTA